MADCIKAILSLGNFDFVIHGDVNNKTDFDNNIKWVVDKDSNNHAIYGDKPNTITWAKVKADMDKQDAFVSQDKINKKAKEYLASTDWYHQRARDGGKEMPNDVKAKRISERAKIVSYEEFKG